MRTQIHLNHFKVPYEQGWIEILCSSSLEQKSTLDPQHPPNLDTQTPAQEEMQRAAQRPGCPAPALHAHPFPEALGDSSWQ